MAAFAVLVIVALAIFGVSHLLTDRSGVARAVAWGESDIGDQGRFPKRRVPRAGPVWRLPQAAAPPGLGTTVRGIPLDRFLADHKTRSFIVLQHGKIVYERYFNGSSKTTVETSFSMAKSIVSTLVGLAVDEGRIRSVDTPVTAFVPELGGRDPRFRRITLRHLLEMASGIRYVERGLPWSDDAITYYGTNLRELALKRPKLERPPAQRWLYNNFHPLLLGLVLERATGMSVSQYTARRLWGPLGAEADASWSVDSEERRFEKLESGFNARPRDWARIGLAMLRGGRGSRERIVSKDWVRQATRPSRLYPGYAYMWWTLPRGAYSARGKYGQVVAVVPERDAVVVRLGSDDADVDWYRFAYRLAQRLPPQGPRN